MGAAGWGHKDPCSIPLNNSYKSPLYNLLESLDYSTKYEGHNFMAHTRRYTLGLRDLGLRWCRLVHQE